MWNGARLESFDSLGGLRSRSFAVGDQRSGGVMQQRLVQVWDGASQWPVGADRREDERKPSEGTESFSMLDSFFSGEFLEGNETEVTALPLMPV